METVQMDGRNNQLKQIGVAFFTTKIFSDEIGRSYYSPEATFALSCKCQIFAQKYSLLQAQQNFFVQIFVHFKNLLYLCALICEVCAFAEG